MVIKTEASSPYRGVFFRQGTKLWYACVCIGYRSICAGAHKREEDAARAYDAKVSEFFARPILNFDPVTGERNKDSKEGKNLGPLRAAFPYLAGGREGRASSSIYRGVTNQRRYKKWQVGISYRGRVIYVGMYATEEMAARAHDVAASRYFGRPVLNFDPITDLPNPDRKADRHR